MEISHRITGEVLASVPGNTLRCADLAGADLAGADLTDADLRSADLRSANLTGANLTGAKGLPPIESLPDFRAQLLAVVEQTGNRLDMVRWHTCETTHCLAGWITTLHPQGEELERLYQTGTAASLILHACGEKIPDFYDTSEGANERAMNWLRTGKQGDSPMPG
jgi:uncharacterized protein YjbI with pentapeptide repeats